ncbi:MAG: undecaprenyl-diphosphate phosphatase [Gammaproteobacteria bacterium]|nr:undecaprenyl-diphosphate phosphatase [Gammaproteobacteria bacterium]
MDLSQIIVLAVLQGITEFLPISSSAHLILVPKIFAWPDQGLAFDVAVHVGTLSAVMWYFRAEIFRMSIDWVKSVTRFKQVGESQLAWMVIIATIPAVIFGLMFKNEIETTFRSPVTIIATTVGFGLLLWYADFFGRRVRHTSSLTWFDALLIGVAQAISIIPGTSRSGATMTMGLMLGLTREHAARFSFLMSIPTILGAGLLKSKDLIEQTQAVDWNSMIIGALISGIVAYLCITAFFKILERIGMFPFVIYRLLLGGVLYIIFV